MATFTTASHTFAVGETVTAATLNGQLRNLIDGFGGYTAYAPVWTSSGTAPSPGNATLTGAYLQVGKFVDFRIILTMGSSTTYGTGQFRLTLPSAGPVTAVRQPFLTDYYDTSGTAAYTGSASWDNTNVCIGLNATPTTAGNPNRAVGAAAPFTWAVGDIITVSGSYEAA